jgi:hypothetical protein
VNIRLDHKRQGNASSPDDERTWADLKKSLREQYPNPQREGCPGEAILRKLALGSLPLAEAEPWLDHLGRCSECFCEFEMLKIKISRQRRLRLSLAAAAVLLLGISAAIWFRSAHEQKNAAHAPDRTSTPEIPGSPSQQLTTAVLHFENPSTTRGGDDDGAAVRPQQLPRKAVALSIYLPLNEEAGKYEVQFLKSFADSTPVLAFEAGAQLENGLPVLRNTTDFSALDPGLYAVRFRRSGGGWRYSRVVLQ